MDDIISFYNSLLSLNCPIWGILYQNMSRTIFSKCFIVLQENENSPLPNVLLLMQCQSAPVKRCSISGGNGGEGDHGNSEH